MKKDWDEKIYKSIAIKRSALFKPIAQVLEKLHISPDLISFTGLGFMVAFVLILENHPIIAFWLTIGMLVMDQLDGALARHKGTASDRGKFVDVAIDTTSFALMMIGMVQIGIFSPVIGMAILYITILSRVLSPIKKNIGRKSDWLFYSGAEIYQAAPFYWAYVLYGLYVFANINIFKPVYAIIIATLVVRIIQDYWTIRYKTKVN